MKTLRYQLSFQSPAFLGNASQQAQWRTPPIKALLRQWWRVAYAAGEQFDVNVAAMRREEALLFGHAWLEDDVVERNGKTEKTAARKSEIRLRLSHWDEGKPQQQWPQFATVSHPEVSRSIAADLYLGYGPVTLPKGSSKPTLKANAALQAGERATFSLALPDEETGLIEQALYLLDRFATAGGRSRNGWGSLHLEPQDGTAALKGNLPLRDWRQALTLDWPHAVGQDGQGALIWQTRPFDDWKALMRELASLKIGLRTQFKLPKERPDGQIHDRHWLSYPITHHSVKDWGNNARLPNSLRFKVCPAPGNPKQCVGVIFHMPCLPPPAFRPDMQAITRVWKQVHTFLDTPAQKLIRMPA